MRLIATDVDGTILTTGEPVREAVVSAFGAARAAGILTVLATGRPLRWLGAVVDQLGGVDALVIANGALVYRLPSGRVDGSEELLDQRTIEPDSVIEWAVRLRASAPAVAYGLERPGGFGAEPGYENVAGTRIRQVGSLPELLEADPVVVKMLAKVPRAAVASPAPGDALLATARRALKGCVVPVHSNPANPLVEIGPAGVDKGSGLAVLADALGVTAAEVTAVGDMPNDVPMLSWAGSSYAMSDGHPEALEAAGAITPPVREDGAAAVIRTVMGAL